MKTSGWVASGIGAVVLVGGGIWAATTLPASDEGTVTAVEETQAPTEAPDPVETATVEPDETVEPAPEETVTPEYSEAESEYLYGAHQVLSYRQIDLPDAELLTAGYAICDALEAGEQLSDIRIIDGLEGTVLHNDLNATARNQLCD